MFVGKERKITVRRAELLEKLKGNLEQHKADFEKSHSMYKKAVVEWLKESLAKAETGNFVDSDLRHDFSRPRNHTGEIDAAISMVEMSIDDTIVLDEQTFKQWIMGKWDWAEHFESASASLSGYLMSKGINN